ncbi:MAG: GTPase ObgE [bacterium]|nr:GTPase ObgE [bacterium]
MFVDEVKIVVRSGKGGDGIIAFRRENNVPKGGPAGGDGGKGGDIIFEADQGMTTLVDLRYMKHVFAKNGENGKHKNMRGKDAEDTIVKVPTGSIFYNHLSNEVLADLTKHGERVVIAPGGRGGRGNQAFASPRNKAPHIQENGSLGKEFELRIELKLLADVGLVGFPSVGKSTLITAVSQSRPKIAEYAFTTLIPNLGVVDVDGVKSFVMADLPGIIEGAHTGIGLGLQFLKHIERTRVIVHVIDMSPTSLRDPFDDYGIIRNELERYKLQLGKRPEIIVANKMDMDGSQERLAQLKEQLGPDKEVFAISAMNRFNILPLLRKIAQTIDSTPLFNIYDDMEEDKVLYTYTGEDIGYVVEKPSDHLFVVSGPKIDQLMSKSNFLSDEAVSRFIRQLRVLGVDEALRAAGAANMDTVKISDFEFDFVD